MRVLFSSTTDTSCRCSLWRGPSATRGTTSCGPPASRRSHWWRRRPARDGAGRSGPALRAGWVHCRPGILAESPPGNGRRSCFPTCSAGCWRRNGRGPACLAREWRPDLMIHEHGELAAPLVRRRDADGDPLVRRRHPRRHRGLRGQRGGAHVGPPRAGPGAVAGCFTSLPGHLSAVGRVGRDGPHPGRPAAAAGRGGRAARAGRGPAARLPHPGHPEPCPESCPRSRQRSPALA